MKNGTAVATRWQNPLGKEPDRQVLVQYREEAKSRKGVGRRQTEAERDRDCRKRDHRAVQERAVELRHPELLAPVLQGWREVHERDARTRDGEGFGRLAQAVGDCPIEREEEDQCDHNRHDGSEGVADRGAATRGPGKVGGAGRASR
ncbi:MAG TPA: hypothetical protein VLE23_17360 [Geminicoccaceae bacterium]|nr:hypothetical protein [Geminicoccaceae bacterium]